MATHSALLAWRILWAEEPGGLLSMGLHRVGHDWSGLACMHPVIICQPHNQLSDIHNQCQDLVAVFTKVVVWEGWVRIYKWVVTISAACAVIKVKESVSRSAMPSSLRPHGLQPARLLCSWDFPGKGTGGVCQFPSPRDLPDPGIKPRSPALRVDSLPAEPPGKPREKMSEREAMEKSTCPWHCLGG